MARWGLFDAIIWHTLMSSLSALSQKSYKGVFNQFLKFLSQNGKDFNSLTIADVLSFSQRAVRDKLSASRCRTIVAAIKFFLRVYNRLDLADSPLFNLFLKGSQKLAPLPQKRSVVWDPRIVLELILKKPRPTTFLDLSREAVILLLLATGLRVDDVSKLSVKVVFDDSAREIPYFEKRKCKINKEYSLSQKLKRFSDQPRICPVNALEALLSCQQKRKPSEVALFVSSRGTRATPDTLRRWAKLSLPEAGVIAPAGSCRSATTSAAFHANCPLEIIMKSAGWSVESTFRRFYERQVLKPLSNQETFNLFQYLM